MSLGSGAPPRAVSPLTGPVDAVVPIPGSKSLSNRALLCAALAQGTSHLSGVLVADDTRAMIGALTRLHVDVDLVDPEAGRVEVVGTAGRFPEGPLDLDVNLSGTCARFLLPALGIGPGPYRLDGAPPLQARPMGPAITALRHLGVAVSERGHPGHLPVVVDGRVTGASVEAPGSLSSQFVSGLLLAAPCYRDGLTVEVADALVSAPYVAMTRQVMTTFGAQVSEPGDGRYQVAPGGYRSAAFAVEPDASSASYFFAAAAVCGGRVRVEGLGAESMQGDLGFVRVLEEMGARVRQTDRFTEVTGTGTLHGVDVDLVDMPDMAQTLAAVAVFADGPTRVRGVAVIRGHETDRVAAVATELARLGVEVEVHDDGWVIQPGVPGPARVETYDDHRMAMSFALVGLVAPGVEIADPGCVAKTFPAYWDLLDRLRDGTLVPGD